MGERHLPVDNRDQILVLRERVRELERENDELRSLAIDWACDEWYVTPTQDDIDRALAGSAE